MIKENAPNGLTLANLSCGCIGVVACFNNNLMLASYAIWLAGFFDFFDGFTSRLLNVSSKLGKELDSLADMVSFGLLPSAIIYVLLVNNGAGNWAYLSFSIALFSAMRLAKFNVDPRQASSFIGMPTPAAAFFVSGLPFWSAVKPQNVSNTSLYFTTILLSLLMIVPMRMLSLKFESYSFRQNSLKYLLVLGSIALLIVFKTLSLPLIILLYLILSASKAFLSKGNSHA